jgi:nucleoside-diphosphate-sugar epimerase
VWQGIEQGLKAVIVNPAIIIGPGNWQRGSSSLFTNIYKGMKFYTEGITGYVDVTDVIKCMRLLMEKNKFGERFVLVSENRSYKDVFYMIASALGAKRPSIKATPFLGTIAWRASKLGWILFRKPPVITRETVRAGFNKVYFSNKKIKNTCNMEFIPLEKSIQKTAGFFKSPR